MVLTQIFPQNLLLSFAAQPTETFLGMPWFDETNSVLKFDTSGGGIFVAALPQHTTTGEHGPKVTIDQTGADNALIVTKSNVGGGVAMQLTNAGTGAGLDLTQNGDALGLGITQNADQLALSVVKVPGGTEDVVFIENQSGTGGAIHVVQSANGEAVLIENVGTNVGLTVNQSGAGNPAAVVAKFSTDLNNALEVKNSGTGAGILVDQAANGFPISIANAGTKSGINITQTGLLPDNSDNAIVQILSQQTATAGAGLRVRNDTAGWAPSQGMAHILQNTTGSSARCLRIDNMGTGASVDIDHTNTGTSNVVDITNSGTGDGLFIDQVGAGRAMEINHAGGSNSLAITQSGNGDVISINNTGTGLDIKGNNWNVDASGNATFNTVTAASSLKMFEVIRTSSTGAMFESLNGATSWTDVPGIAFTQTFAGGTVRVEAQLQCENTIYAGWGAGWVRMRVLLDGAVVTGSYDSMQVEPAFGWNSSWGALRAHVHTTVSSGSHTFKMQYQTQHNGAGNPLSVSRRELRVTEVDYTTGLSSITQF